MTESPLRVRCTHWQPLKRGALLGYAAIELVAYGVIVSWIPISAGAVGSQRSHAPAARQRRQRDPEGRQAGADADIGVRRHRDAERFVRATVAALRGKFPAGLPTAGGAQHEPP